MLRVIISYQNLHTKYLKEYDYKGVFYDLRSPDQLWTPICKWIPFVAKLLELSYGEEKKRRFYEKMFYFGIHRFQLGLFGRYAYNKTYRGLRRPYVVPLAALAQLDDVSLTYPKNLFTGSD